VTRANIAGDRRRQENGEVNAFFRMLYSRAEVPPDPAAVARCLSWMFLDQPLNPPNLGGLEPSAAVQARWPKPNLAVFSSRTT
jgi:hypothetical protein